MRLPCFFLQNRTNNFWRHWLRPLLSVRMRFFFTPCRAYQTLGEKQTGFGHHRRILRPRTRLGRFFSSVQTIYASISHWFGKISAARLRTVYSNDTGHTPRKLPPFGAISRFIAYAFGHTCPTRPYRIPNARLCVKHFLRIIAKNF